MKVALNGFFGQMGQIIYNLSKNFNDIEIVYGIDRKEIIIQEKQDINGVKITNNIYDATDCDIVIDFSSNSAISRLLDFCIKYKKPLVLATTGFNNCQEQEIINASKFIPIFKSGNFSQGIHYFLETIKVIAKKTFDWDIEICEVHHNKKIDIPSGTAKMMFQKIKEVRPNLVANIGRQNTYKIRTQNEVGIHSLRGGGVVGEHIINFYNSYESISIKHTAFSREVFAFGAIKACKFLINKQNGIYEMKNLFD